MVLTNAIRYWGSFFICGCICVIFQLDTLISFVKYKFFTVIDDENEKSKIIQESETFTDFQVNYLIVFLLAMFADWLQGPYVYQLYVSYGFDQSEIAELFVCGFGSSMIVGTIVGSLADKYGRKLMCIVYCITYIAACFTKLVPEFWTLMLGRFLSGISASLLFSVFESWMVCEHFKNGFSSVSLGKTFSFAIFGNGLIAVIAGLVANIMAHSSIGYVAPFLLAIIPLIAVAVIVSTTWSENYGDGQKDLNMFSSLNKGFDFIRTDSRIAALALAQSCFEGAMYTFVFMWTPALKSEQEYRADEAGLVDPESTNEYLGLIFSVFMTCVMVGSSAFKLVAIKKEHIYKVPLLLHLIAAITMFSVAFFIDFKDIVYFMFLLFEIMVGLFYPSYSVIKSEKIPEDIRSSVMNIFRIPLNLFVVVLLLKIKLLSPTIVFTICGFTHLVSFSCYFHFYSATKLNYSSVANAEPG